MANRLTNLLSQNFLNYRLACTYVVLLLCQFRITEISGSECGTVSPIESRTSYSTFRIGGGDEVQKGDYPFVAALYQTNERQFFCGGTLISVKHVLTGIGNLIAVMLTY